MAQIRGTVISISLDTAVAKKDGGSYQGWELVYKTQDGKIQNIAKPIQGLKFGTLKGQLSTLSPGAQFTLEYEKNAAGFNDVKTVVLGWGDGTVSAPSAPSSTASGNTGAKGNSYQASSYPTADERNKTQNHIIRQSSLAQAVATSAIGGKAVTPEKVLELAEIYANWVKQAPDAQAAIDAIENDLVD